MIVPLLVFGAVLLVAIAAGATTRRRESSAPGERLSATVPELGEMIDVSTFAVQDMLTVLGFSRVPRDGVWGTETEKGFFTWARRAMPGVPITVIPKERGQTISIPSVMFGTLRTRASEAARTELARRGTIPPNPYVLGGTEC